MYVEPRRLTFGLLLPRFVPFVVSVIVCRAIQGFAHGSGLGEVLPGAVACRCRLLQEVNGQERPNHPRALVALTELLAGTNLAGATMISTKPQGDEVYDVRNLVVVSHLAVVGRQQLRNDLVAEPAYRRLTAIPPDAAEVAIGVERPTCMSSWNCRAGPAARDQRAPQVEDPHRRPRPENTGIRIVGDDDTLRWKSRDSHTGTTVC